MMNVLVIGGSRFLGKAIVRSFLKKGIYNVFVMNRGTRSNLEGVAGAFLCDRNDRDNFGKVLKDRPWDVIVDTILDAKDLEFVIETLGTNVGHFIHTGSIGVYGDARKIPAPEWLPMMESDCEAEGQVEERIFNYKIKQDECLQRAYNEKRFPMSILRMSNVYGRGDVPLDGLGGRNPEYFKRIIRGETVEVSENGRALLQPGHVEDLGRAFAECAERPFTIGQVYNIGGDWSLMIKDYVRLIAKIFGTTAKLEYVDRTELRKRYGHADDFVCQHMCSDITKAARDLDWHPQIALEAGLRDNFEWMKEVGKL